ncbi:DUF4198 domain-containing protein [Albidovulum sediminicola]|uniref:DUF4198 domain-containing protein n=1 Tax=Albidovulum sediminicola TaxID=2984331 RepID=A0ABT2Z5N8_9RHOB|nr:DUF4198 domain-containing protein [Defluviimonas sp. WL0075]MCV2866381.1 DUF4198 domain-containing protein [Defluviimonas sp. WL0075]
MRAIWIGLVANILAVTGAVGHEFWIAPESYRSDPGAEITAHLRVGQDMSGDAIPYLSRTVAGMGHWGPDSTSAIGAREGDLPAIAGVGLDAPGLHRLSVETNPAYIVFDTLTDFADYLAYEGLDAVAALHRERGLAETEIAEAYIRNARTLVQVGPAREDQRDAPTGMAFELTALGNPYLPGQSGIEVLLQWQGVAEAETQLAIFHLPLGGTAPADTVRTLTRTDAKGRARIAIDAAGTYLLNSVHMEPVEGPGSVVWQSHWASLTFAVAASR